MITKEQVEQVLKAMGWYYSQGDYFRLIRRDFSSVEFWAVGETCAVYNFRDSLYYNDPEYAKMRVSYDMFPKGVHKEMIESVFFNAMEDTSRRYYASMNERNKDISKLLLNNN